MHYSGYNSLQQLKTDISFEHGLTGVALYAYHEKVAQKLEKMATQTDDETLFKLCNTDELSEKIGLNVVHGGAFIPSGGWLSPVQFVQNTFAYLQSKGVKIVLNHEVTQPDFKEGKWMWHNLILKRENGCGNMKAKRLNMKC